jgi:hypothetical protein
MRFGIWTYSCGCMLKGCLWVSVFSGSIGWINTFRSFRCPSLWNRGFLWRFLGYISLIHAFLLFRYCYSRTCAWWRWRRSNLFYSPAWVGTLSSSPFFEFWFLFLPLGILETLFCALKELSATVLPQDKNWSFTIMHQSSLWVALSEMRLKTQDRRLQICQKWLGRIKNSTLSKYWWPML